MAESAIDSLNGIKSAFEDAKKAGENYGNSFQRIAKKMMPFALAAKMFLAVLSPTISVAADFEAQMSSLGAVSKASASEMALMKQSALDLGAQTGFAAGEIVTAQEELSKSGFNPDQIVGAMPDILNLATAAQCDLSAAVSVSSAAMDRFNIKAADSGKVADILASASASGMDLAKLGKALDNAGTAVGKSGVSFAEFAAITDTMTGANIKAASVGNATTAMFNNLTAPTDAAAKALKKLDFDPSKSGEGLMDMLGGLEKALAGMGETEKAAVLTNIFGKEGLAPVTALLNKGTSDITAFAGKLGNDTGRAAEMAREKLNNLKGSLSILNSATTGLAIIVGSTFTPILKVLVDVLITVVGWLTAMAKHPVGKAILMIVGGISAAVVVLTVFSGVMSVASGVMTLLSGGMTAFSMVMSIGAGLMTFFSGVMSVASAAVTFFNLTILANPIGLIALGIIALGAVIYTFWDDITAALTPFINTLKTVWDILCNVGPLGVFAYYFTDTYNYVTNLWGQFTGFFDGLWDNVLASSFAKIDEMISGFKNFSFTDWISDLISGIPDAIASIKFPDFGEIIFGSTISDIKNSKLYGNVKGVFSKVRNLFPSSDAKEGPLSTLTLSGSRMMETLATGVQGAAPALIKTTAGAAAGVSMALGTAMADPGQYTSGINSLPAIATPYEQAAEGASGPQHATESGEARSQGSRVVIEHLHVQLPDVSDADSFVQALQTLVSSYGGQD
ncbi:phage tail tape measure protein [Desulfoluna spongiiphila]|uniref:phage tail tape measure protein n=1 Tax=Desulfoluna spongiiphila TaxID=419481 RepID=UPI00125EF83D|nr:phage tail tape measure protein [Desulfoluna spongiiphila]